MACPDEGCQCDPCIRKASITRWNLKQFDDFSAVRAYNTVWESLEADDGSQGRRKRVLRLDGNE